MINKVLNSIFNVVFRPLMNNSIDLDFCHMTKKVALKAVFFFNLDSFSTIRIKSFATVV